MAESPPRDFLGKRAAQRGLAIKANQGCFGRLRSYEISYRQVRGAPAARALIRIHERAVLILFFKAT